MARDSDAFIAELVGDLKPVRPLKFALGFGYVFVALAATLLATLAAFGSRKDIATGAIDPVLVVSAGLFLVLGLASAATVIVMARPRVGSSHDEWHWAGAMAGLLPLAATCAIASGRGNGVNVGWASQGLGCAMMGSLLALITYAALVVWLRRGAPTSLEQAGLLTGVAAGCFGSFAFSFHCPSNDFVHIGIWHSFVVLIGACFGRFATPPLIRW